MFSNDGPAPSAEKCELCGWRHGIGWPCIAVKELAPGETNVRLAYYWGGPEVQAKAGRAGFRARYGYEKSARR